MRRRNRPESPCETESPLKKKKILTPPPSLSDDASDKGQPEESSSGKMPRRRKYPQLRRSQRILAVQIMKRRRLSQRIRLAVRIMKRRRQSPPEESDAAAPTSDKVQPEESGSSDMILKDKKRKERSGKRERKEKERYEVEKIIRALEKRKKRMKIMEAGKIKYPSFWIPPKNFTMTDYLLYRPYMYWRNFEHVFPIQRKYKRLKLFYDQVRKTRGYGVTIPNPYPGAGHLFCPRGPTLGKNTTLAIQMPKMVDALVKKMQQKLKGKPVGMRLTNAVYCPMSRIYLISHSFEQQSVIPTSPGEVEAVADAVEAMFSVRPGSKHIVLREWKLKRGSQMVYCSSCTKKAMEYFKNWFYTYVDPK